VHTLNHADSQRAFENSLAQCCDWCGMRKPPEEERD
jgi:hypothetical protein